MEVGMARRAGASVRSRRLAYVLRKLRVASGLSCVEFGEVVGMSSSKISRVETCDSGIYIDDVEKMLDFYEIGGTRRMEILDLARHAEQRGWLRMQGPDLPRDWQTWVDFEAEASALSMYQPLMIPGLAQTAEYARAIIQATGSDLSDDQIDVLVTSRLSRQALLSRSRPLNLHLIIEEDVLTRPVGDQGVHSRQLNYLADMAARPNISVRVMPTDAGLHSGLNGPFVIMDYDEEASLVLLENKVASLFLDEEEYIDTYSRSWVELLGLAYDDDTSVEVIRAVAKRVAG
jgi:hypothetical protein